MPVLINYPPSMEADRDKLYSVYSILEQMRLERNSAIAEAKASNVPLSQVRKYNLVITKKLKAVIAEQNELREKIRKSNYTDNQWSKMTPDQIKNACLSMYGDRGILRELPTLATTPLMDEIKAIDIASLHEAEMTDPTEDLTTYTESDSGGYVSLTADRLTFTDLPGTSTSYVLRDFTANHFDGNFTHLCQVNIDEHNYESIDFFWALTNEVLSWAQIYSQDKDELVASFESTSGGSLRCYIIEIDGGNFYGDSVSGLSDDTQYYIEIERDEAVGTYGTLYLYLCTGDYYSGGGSLVDTLSIALHSSKKDFRYFWPLQHYTWGDSATMTGYSEYYDLQEVVLIPKTSADSGTGADAKDTGQPLAQSLRYETGAGSDDKVDYPAAVLALTEVGNGEEFLLSRILTALESSLGLDGKEDGNPLADLLVSEGGIGLEAIIDLVQFIAKTGGDSGLGADTLMALLALTAVCDNGSGVDAVFSRLFGAAENGSGSDLASLLASVTGASEAGSAAETSLFLPAIVSGDTELGSELLFMLKAILSTDAGKAEDILKYLLATAGSSTDIRLPGRSGQADSAGKGRQTQGSHGQADPPSKEVGL